MIEKLSNYVPGLDPESLTENITVDGLRIDKTMISVNYATVPATVTILDGSLIGYNGDTFLVSGDETFQMSNATHNYITFNGNNFNSSSSIGLFDIKKQGYYLSNSRTLKFYIDQSNESEFVLIDVLYPDLTIFSKTMDRIKVGLLTNFTMTGAYSQLPFNTIHADSLSSWDTTNHNFTVQESGYYYMYIHGSTDNTSGSLLSCKFEIRKNNVNIFEFLLANVGGTIYDSAYGSGNLFYLKKNEIIDVWCFGSAAFVALSGVEHTYFLLARFL